jgi:hypothetical protein
MSDKIFDLELTSDPVLYHKIKEQTDLYLELFQLLANEFSHQDLSLIHATSKGTKVSNGYRLGNSPYQVLDLIRDFDSESAFNIRILNWWGNGLFFFILYGNGTAIKMEASIKRLLKDYLLSSQKSPWDYKEIINKIPNQEIYINNSTSGFLQLYKKLRLEPDFDKTYSILKKEIRFIFDNHH